MKGAVLVDLIFFTSTPSADFSTFTGFATELLTWLVTTFTTVLNWMLAHPIAFVGLVMSLIVAAIGTLRHIIGGSSSEEKKPILQFWKRKKAA